MKCEKKGSCGNCLNWTPYSEGVGQCLSLFEVTSMDECCGEWREDPVKTKEEKI